MLKRILAAASVAVLALTLTGCEPSQFEKDCAARGGETMSRVTGYIPVLVGKVVVMSPVLQSYCKLPDGSEINA